MLKYPLTAPALGVDVSKYQGGIDWGKVKAAGYGYVFVRLGYANGDGTVVLDPYFARNVEGAAAAGLNVGVYLYSYIDSEDHARMAAARVLELLEEYRELITLPVVLDYEHAAKYAAFDRDKNSRICNAFLGMIYRAGYLPMYYSYTSFVDSYMNLATLDQYQGMWIANYTGKIGVDNAAVWQYSSTGRVPGIPGRVDLNRMYCDLPRIVAEGYTNGEVEFAPLTGKQLEVFAENRCEYFTAPDINAVVYKPDGGTTKLPVGTYDVEALAETLVDGYPMVRFQYEGETVYAAILDDRCRLVDAPEEGLLVRLTPVPNEGDRRNIENYCKGLGFEVNWIW